MFGKCIPIDVLVVIGLANKIHNCLNQNADQMHTRPQQQEEQSEEEPSEVVVDMIIRINEDVEQRHHEDGTHSIDDEHHACNSPLALDEFRAFL